MVVPLKVRFDTILKALDPPASDEKRLAALHDQLRDLRSFTDAIRELSTADDPTALLAPAYDENGQGIPNYFEHRIGGWVGYWYVDHRERICTGVHVRHDLDSEIETLRSVLENVLHRPF